MTRIRTGNRRRLSLARRAIEHDRPTLVITWAADGKPPRIRRERPLAPETVQRIASGIKTHLDAFAGVRPYVGADAVSGEVR